MRREKIITVKDTEQKIKCFIGKNGQQQFSRQTHRTKNGKSSVKVKTTTEEEKIEKKQVGEVSFCSFFIS